MKGVLREVISNDRDGRGTRRTTKLAIRRRGVLSRQKLVNGEARNITSSRVPSECCRILFSQSWLLGWMGSATGYVRVPGWGRWWDPSVPFSQDSVVKNFSVGSQWVLSTSWCSSTLLCVIPRCCSFPWHVENYGNPGGPFCPNIFLLLPWVSFGLRGGNSLVATGY